MGLKSSKCDFLDSTGSKCNGYCPIDSRNKQECMYCGKNIVLGCGGFDRHSNAYHSLPNHYGYPPICEYWKYAPCEECIVNKNIIRCPNCHLISMNASKIDIKCMKCQHLIYIGCNACDDKKKLCRQCYIESERETMLKHTLGSSSLKNGKH
jgi:hypothetical protein